MLCAEHPMESAKERALGINDLSKSSVHEIKRQKSTVLLYIWNEELYSKTIQTMVKEHKYETFGTECSSVVEHWLSTLEALV